MPRSKHRSSTRDHDAPATAVATLEAELGREVVRWAAERHHARREARRRTVLERWHKQAAALAALDGQIRQVDADSLRAAEANVTLLEAAEEARVMTLVDETSDIDDRYQQALIFDCEVARVIHEDPEISALNARRIAAATLETNGIVQMVLAERAHAANGGRLSGQARRDGIPERDPAYSRTRRRLAAAASGFQDVFDEAAGGEGCTGARGCGRSGQYPGELAACGKLAASRIPPAEDQIVDHEPPS
jgi:hypothetical protein